MGRAFAIALLLLGCCACGAEERLTTGLHVSLTNVGWDQTGDHTWKMTGARVDLDCRLQKMVVEAGHAERDRSPSVSELCAAIRADSTLLQAPEKPPRCSEYGTGTVAITGSWRGRHVELVLPTCTGARDPGARWARLLGFSFLEPDPPA